MSQIKTIEHTNIIKVLEYKLSEKKYVLFSWERNFESMHVDVDVNLVINNSRKFIELFCPCEKPLMERVFVRTG